MQQQGQPSPPSVTAASTSSSDSSAMQQLQQENQSLKEEVERLRNQLALLLDPRSNRDTTASESTSAAVTGSNAPMPASTAPPCDSPSLVTPTFTCGTCRPSGATPSCSSSGTPAYEAPHNMTKDQIMRYSRHLLLPSFGAEAQARLCNGSVLIVGCGGLGSPAALYLAAAGVGRLGLVDHDSVELSNLHRQVIHSEARVGCHKALSAREACLAMNSGIQVEVFTEGFTPANAVGIVGQFDVVIDASDNPPTRYLVSDACCVAGRPLVSAAAVGTDGQMTVYNFGEEGPCYRCLYPEAPAPENCSRCADAGVLGVVPGVMGTLQALEAIKVLSKVGAVMSQRLTVFDALAGRFSAFKLRGRRPGCVACCRQVGAKITKETLAEYDYAAFTGQAPNDGPPKPLTLIPPQERVTVQQLKAALSSTQKTDQTQAQAQAPSLLLIDVRPRPQYDAMHLPGAISMPVPELARQAEAIKRMCGLPAAPGGSAEAAEAGAQAGGAGGQAPAAAAGTACDAGACSSAMQLGGDGGSSSSSTSATAGQPGGLREPPPGAPAVYVMCRRGNLSQIAVGKLREMGVSWAVDVVGGYSAWAEQVDPRMPLL